MQAVASPIAGAVIDRWGYAPVCIAASLAPMAAVAILRQAESPGERHSRFLRLAGKHDRKVSAVFGFPRPLRDGSVARQRSQRSVWLFTVTPPDPETAALCERVVVINSLDLLVKPSSSGRIGSPRVATWTGERGAWT
jgi:hypothetical protein